ncbi:hypothetical protein [Deinococcus hopiensis]|uniref:Uncharacterized protein n=1 Tax=Deinococcus hopiensis KR-140 TaxID=695939 RepID=A0A1W1VV01_9DEIO|nr:hypothetical protein [Deinococcus hopiensis]SMB97050.1 hypothetical protein SAMN00790413_06313 [Deinococcus hopiensis KR-140]
MRRLGTPEMTGQGHLILRSSAFTAFTSGLRVDIHGDRPNSLEVMGLGVTGNPAVSEASGLQVRHAPDPTGLAHRPLAPPTTAAPWTVGRSAASACCPAGRTAFTCSAFPGNAYAARAP